MDCFTLPHLALVLFFTVKLVVFVLCVCFEDLSGLQPAIYSHQYLYSDPLSDIIHEDAILFWDKRFSYSLSINQLTVKKVLGLFTYSSHSQATLGDNRYYSKTVIPLNVFALLSSSVCQKENTESY